MTIQVSDPPPRGALPRGVAEVFPGVHAAVRDPEGKWKGSYAPAVRHLAAGVAGAFNCDELRHCYDAKLQLWSAGYNCNGRKRWWALDDRRKALWERGTCVFALYFQEETKWQGITWAPGDCWKVFRCRKRRG